MNSTPLRIAFDLDGVLADMGAALAREADELFGRNGEAPNGSDGGEPDDEFADELSAARLTWRQRKRLWARVGRIENFWESLEEIEPGAVARIASLAEEHFWHVLFITTRPQTAGSTCQVQSQRWLQRHGFPLPSVFVVSGSRGKIAAALSLDFVIDDRPENCLDVVLESTAKGILICRSEREHLAPNVGRLGIDVADSVADCLNMLSKASEIRNRSPLMDRVRRLLGVSGEE